MDKAADLIVRHGRVLTMDTALGEVTDCDIAVANGEIIEIRPNIQVPAGCTVVEAAGNIVMPGLVDTHTHMWNGLWRSYAGSGGAETSYGALGLGMGPLFTPEDSYNAVLGAALEMLGNGITTVHNWAHNMVSIEHANAEIQALKDVGVRARFSYGYRWDQPQDQLMPLDDVLTTRKRWAGGLLDVGIALRNDTTQGQIPGFFAALSIDPALLGEEIAVMRENHVPLTMHIRNPGPASYFIDAGYIAPDNLIIHGYHWRKGEWNQLADAGIRISVAPYSCLHGLNKLMPLGEALSAGVTLGVSFDHMNGSGNADMFRLMQLMVMNEAVRNEAPLSWHKAVEIATTDGAAALGLGEVTGSLTVGKRADIIILDAETLGMAPLHDVPMAVVNSASPSTVDTVIVDGVVLKSHGSLVGWDAGDVARRVDSTFRGLRERYESAV